jgi:hypothetical protein
MSKIFCTAFIAFIGISLAFVNQDYFEWSKDKKLDYADFKAKIPANAGSGLSVNLSTLVSYTTSQAQGQVPKITVFNYVDRSNSWIKVKKTEVLEIQQIKFDQTELNVRKIRKEMDNMNKKGVKDRQKYIDVITKMNQTAKAKMQSKFVMLEDQPHLIKIMKKDISDSLNLYKSYAK